MVDYPFGQYLVTPDGEQWFPFFHLIFYGLVQMAGERYYLLVLVNCLGTGVNAFLVFLFFRRHLSSGLALTLSALYATAAVHHAIAWNSFYVGYLLSLGFFLGALLLTDSYLRSPGRTRCWYAPPLRRKRYLTVASSPSIPSKVSSLFFSFSCWPMSNRQVRHVPTFG